MPYSGGTVQKRPSGGGGGVWGSITGSLASQTDLEDALASVGGGGGGLTVTGGQYQLNHGINQIDETTDVGFDTKTFQVFTTAKVQLFGETDIELAAGEGHVIKANSPLMLGPDDPTDSQQAASKGYVDEVAGGGTSVVLSTTVTISAAEILAMTGQGVAPKTLVAALGAGKAIMPLTCVEVYHPGDTPFNSGSGQYGPYPQAGDIGNDYFTRTSGNSLGFDDLIPWMTHNVAVQSGDPVANYENTPILWAITSTGSGADNGIGNGSLAVTLTYIVVDV